MSSIRSTTGLASGLDIGALAESLVLRQRATVARFEARSDGFAQRQTAIGLLEANVLSLQSAGTALTDADAFDQRSVSNTNSDAVSVSVDETTAVGSLAIRSVQLASSHAVLSDGFAAPDAALPAGQVVIRRGGRVAQPTRLELLNGGAGVSGGTIKLTDRSGDSAVIDLSDAVTIEDVARKVRESGLDLELSAHDDALRLTGTGGGAGSIVVEDLTGSAAADLGLAGSSATDTLDGSSVFEVTGSFTLDLLNDGNGPNVLIDGADNPDLEITATDGAVLTVVLDEAETLNEVIAAINGATDNNGKVTASLVNGRLQLDDTAGGAGTLSVADNGNSDVVRTLGLTTTAAGTTLTGERLHGGLNSVLLRNLNGGAGIDTPGLIAITDGNGDIAAIDLTAAETLQDVVDAINGAVTSLPGPLGVTAAIDEAGTGLILTDTTGVGTLSVVDTVGTSAADLGLTAPAAGGTIAGGSLNLRTVSESTSLADYAPDGDEPAEGLFQITDSAGNTTAIRVNSAVNTIGDLISRINADATINVEAALNETGDGFVLIDQAGGAGTLSVEDIDSTTAADLRLLGDSVVGGDGRQRIVSRDAVVVELDGTQTLEDLVAAINEQTSHATAELLDDGSRLNSTRLQIASTQTGLAGELIFETTGLDLGLLTTSRAADAVARVGTDAATSFVVTSDTNRFTDQAGGVDFTLREVSDEVAQVQVSHDYGDVRSGIESFVGAYNALMTSIDTATTFSLETNQRGVLQGDGFTLRIQQRVQDLFVKRSGPDRELTSLTALGVTADETGQLSFDPERFNDLVEDDPDLVQRFLTDDDRGFGTKVDALVERLTDSVTGAFKTEKDSLQASIDSIAKQVEEMNELLAVRQERIYREFVRMEEIVSSLQAEQQAVAALTGVRQTSSGGNGSS